MPEPDNEKIIEHFAKIQESIKSGNVVLVLGPNTRINSTNKLGEETPSYDEFFAICNNDPNIFSSKLDDLEHDDIVDLAIVDPNGKVKYLDALEKNYSIHRASASIRFVPRFVWRRIYTFDLSDNLEVAYRSDLNRQQRLVSTTVDQPIEAERQYSENLSLIKLFGSVSENINRTYLSLPQFEQILGSSPWIRSLAHDIDRYPVIFLGAAGDGKFLINKLRQVRSLSSSHQNVTFVAPDLNEAQLKVLEQKGIVHLPLAIDVFGDSLNEVFPQGMSIGRIAELASPDISGKNAALSASILSEFELLDRASIEKLSISSERKGQIRRFYRGDEPTWSDVNENIHADLSSYLNFRGRIENALSSGFPNRHLLLLTSPAGLGKSVGLMATALWLRDHVTQPIIWLQPGGDLKRFFVNLKEGDFPEGIFLFVDDITMFKDEFEFVAQEKLEQICVVATSRETKWHTHQAPFFEKLDIIKQEIRALNRSDAACLYERIEQHGTVVHFSSKTANERISEILRRSDKDLLVLIKEMGLGEKFNNIVQSEIDDLDEHQKFLYLSVCVPDRLQIPIPLDLVSNAFRKRFGGYDVRDVVKGMGGLLRFNRNGTSLRTRHSVIATRIVESYRGKFSILEIKQAIEGVLSAFADYRRPIMVHHSNTGHARVFKAYINSKFLTFLLGADSALEMYRKFEKPFEVDGFFWQHFGLTYLRAENFSLAIETLSHAEKTHDHVQIRHSLASAKLLMCLKCGPEKLGTSQFEEVRREAVSELSSLHQERRNRDDISIATLANMDCQIAELYDDEEIRASKLRRYHTELALYLRDFPNMPKAKEAYNQLHNRLTVKSFDRPTLSYDDMLQEDD